MKQLMRQLGLDAIYGLDAETFWASDYTLKGLATTEYVYDPRFEGQIVSVQKDSWAKPRVMEWPAFVRWSKTIDWTRTGMLAHHGHFDGLVFKRHAGFEPAFHFDTLSMARSVMPINVPRNLDALAKALGLKGKVHGQSLINTKGKHWVEFTKDEKVEHKLYAGDDISDTWAIFLKLLPFVPLSELRLINETVGMYAKPRLLMDKSMVEGLVTAEVERKQARLAALQLTVGDLQSNDRFAELLDALGVEPPTKYSEKQNKEVWAFSKQDHDFKALLEHEDDAVRSLVEARLDVKSTSVETRARRLAARADYGAQPIYYNYWGAGTGRWSGGDKANWQNLKRGSLLRKAIMAPPGYSLIIADLSQIEARQNAWCAGHTKKLDVFRAYDTITGWKEGKNGEPEPIRAGPDVYRVTASEIFNTPIHQVDDLLRFLGKTADLGLGFGAGAPKFGSMIRLANVKDPDIIEFIRKMSDSYVRDIHRAWRNNNRHIVASWKSTELKMRQAFISGTTIDDGVVSYQGAGPHGFMHMPNGTALRYDFFEVTDTGMRYMKRYRQNVMKPPTIGYGKLYGGLAIENKIQALARIVVSEHLLQIVDALKYWKTAMMTHDELVGLVPTKYAQRALKVVKQIMSTPPDWAPDLPVAVDAHVSLRYDK